MPGAGWCTPCWAQASSTIAHGRCCKSLAKPAKYTTPTRLAAVAALGAEAVIPSPPRRRVARPIYLSCYRQRNQIERLMSRLKQFRRLATRYDKTASSYLGFVHFVRALLWLR